ncbi:MAG: shikimate dehydrogenase [Pseudomonadota bacterium]
MTLLAGVIGDPIAHSLSPRLHGHWLSRYRISGHYVPLRVTSEDLGTVLGLLPKMGFRGINVTIPHKEAVFTLADIRTERAEAVQAANTLTFADGKLHADNTDGLGLLASLQAGASDWSQNRPALVLGAGGAARGIVAALLHAGVPEVTVANRTVERAAVLQSQFGPKVAAVPLSGIGELLSRQGLVVNTTSLGMQGQPALDMDLADLPKDAVVTDIVYAPLETPLLRQAKSLGLRTVDGLGMLLHQAAPGFAQWFGQRPEVDDALRKAVLAQ